MWTWPGCNPWACELAALRRAAISRPGLWRRSTPYLPAVSYHSSCSSDAVGTDSGADQNGVREPNKKHRSRDRRRLGLERLRVDLEARKEASASSPSSDVNRNQYTLRSVGSLVKFTLQQVHNIEERLRQYQSRLRVQRAQRIARNQRMIFVRRCLGISLRSGFIYIDPQQVEKHDIVFVAIDTEGGNKALPEVGLAFLDTRTIGGVGPGHEASEWYKHIRARHFRLRHNGGHGFKFGVTERIPVAALKPYLKSCFDPRRRYVIVGHSVSGDLDKLSSVLHFDLRQDPCIVGQIDTREIVEDMPMPQKLSLLWRHLRGADSYLGTGLAFHNAGNDAVYNLQVLLMLALTSESEWLSPRPIVSSSEVTADLTAKQLDHHSTTNLSKNIDSPTRELQQYGLEHGMLASTSANEKMKRMAEVFSSVILSLAFAGTILSFTVGRTAYDGERGTSTTVNLQSCGMNMQRVNHDEGSMVTAVMASSLSSSESCFGFNRQAGGGTKPSKAK